MRIRESLPFFGQLVLVWVASFLIGECNHVLSVWNLRPEFLPILYAFPAFQMRWLSGTLLAVAIGIGYAQFHPHPLTRDAVFLSFLLFLFFIFMRNRIRRDRSDHIRWTTASGGLLWMIVGTVVFEPGAFSVGIFWIRWISDTLLTVILCLLLTLPWIHLNKELFPTLVEPLRKPNKQPVM